MIVQSVLSIWSELWERSWDVSQMSSKFPVMYVSVSIPLTRSLRLWSCRRLCHLFRCMTNLPSALSPAQRPPPRLLSHAHPPLHSMGSTSLRRLPPLTRDRCPPTVRHADVCKKDMTAAVCCEYIEMSLLLSPADQSSGRSPVSPGFPQPLRFTPEGGPGKLRPVSITLHREVCFVCKM